MEFRQRIGSPVSILALVVLVLALVALAMSDQGLAEQSPSVVGLTGREVGEALGLEPTTWPVPGGCEYFAEFDDPLGYCFDGVVATKLDAALLGRQINGHDLTADQEELIAVALRMGEMTSGEAPYDAAQLLDLTQQYQQLAARVEAES